MQVRLPEEELKSTKLWQQLSSANSEYAQIVENFVKAISPLLSSIKNIFPYYTRHDAHHSYRVLLRMQTIVDKRCLESGNPFSFKPDELMLLICAAYAHDLGMAVFPDEESELIKTLDIQETNLTESKKLHEYLREKHSERGGQYIAQHNIDLKLPQNLIYVLNLLMEAHNLSINDLELKLGARFAAGSEELDLKQLACILCIADAIEFSETRVVEGVLETITEKLKSSADIELITSYRHNMQHICISDSVTVASDGKIIFTGAFTDPDVMSLAHNTIDLIEGWVRNYMDIDYRSKLKRLIIRTDSIIRQLNIVGYDFERIGIRIKKENIIDLISSNATWTNDPSIVIRELLQNSVEACRYRKFHSPSYYVPHIEVIIDSKERSIEVTDNGCGMSRNIILNNFLTVGNSRSADPSYSSSSYASLARFGIGFWSAFTIAEKTSVETAPFEYLQFNTAVNTVDGVSFEVSIKEFKDFTIFKPVQKEPGTSIKLYLKTGVNIPDLIYKIPYHIGCSEIPIQIKQDSQVLDIPERMVLPTFDETFGSKRSAAIQSNIKEYLYSENTDGIDIQIKMLYGEQGGKLHFVVPGTQTSITILQDRAMHMKFRGYGICGFLFNSIPSTPILDFNRIGHICANAADPKGYKFTINRLGLMDSPEYKKYKDVVQNAIHTCYRKFLTEKRQFNAETIARLNQESRASGGESHGSFTGDSLQKIIEKDADLMAFKLYKIDPKRTFENCEVVYVFYSELLQKNWTIWLSHMPYYHLHFRVGQVDKSLVYDTIKRKADCDDSWYMLEPTAEADRIADSASEGVIDASDKIMSNLTPLPFRRFRADSIQPGTGQQFVIGHIRGTWAGTIVERTIIGAQFVTLYQHHFVVNKDSQLSKDIKEMLAAEQVYQVAELINKLVETTQGYVHESVTKYSGELTAYVVS